MKVAIHHHPGSFSDRWINYCKEKKIDYKLVNAYDSDIINQMSDCDAFMWHFSHYDYKASLFAKQLLYSLEMSGLKVFPDWRTSWHFDDKVGQKYLLESIGAPLVKSYVFYDEEDALKWVEGTSFPKVFKLRGGAGAANVKLIRTKKEAKRIIRIAFNKGFSQFNRKAYLKERYNKWRQGRDSFIGVLKGFGRLFITTEFAKMHAREKGYVYFQDFVANNDHDIRVIVIGDKAFSIKRLCRENDFRASGSGRIIYEKEQLNEESVLISFHVADQLKLQCVGFDFVYSDDRPLIVELGYGFLTSAYDKCAGYWSKDMVWHEGAFNPQEWMIENLLHE